MEQYLPSQLATLGHPQRLAIFQLLMRRYPDHVPAGELAQALALKPSTLSAYLGALLQAQLIVQARAGVSLRYAINMPEAQALLAALWGDCCRGRPELCSNTLPKNPTKRRVLFLCQGNSARSIFAESILRALAGERFDAYSAGTKAGTELNPFALQLLHEKGHDTSLLRAKDVAEFRRADAPRFDFVFTVCDQAANEPCPAWEGRPVTGHWGLPDPAKAQGTAAQKALAFQSTYGALHHRIALFCALDLTQLDRSAVQNAVDDLSRTPKSELK